MLGFLPAIFMHMPPQELCVHCWGLLNAAPQTPYTRTDHNGPSLGSKPRGKPHGLLLTAQKIKSTGLTAVLAGSCASDGLWLPHLLLSNISQVPLPSMQKMFLVQHAS